MAQAIRNQINGTSGQDIMKMNENFEQLWSKVHGDISFGDSDTDMQNRINTQWLPFQGEGNLDSNYPLDIRFFVPPNVKKLKKSEMNIIVTNYRMDSSIAMGGGGFESGDITIGVSGGNAILTLDTEPRKTSTSKISMLDGANWSNPSVGLMKAREVSSSIETYVYDENTSIYYNGGSRVVPLSTCKLEDYDGTVDVLDLAMINHSHDVIIEGHTHRVLQEPHTHSGSFGVNIDPHTHELNEGIKVSVKQPQNVQIILNDNLITTLNSTNPIANSLDVSNYIKIGQWNVIRCTTTTLARVTIYGILEVLIKNY